MVGPREWPRNYEVAHNDLNKKRIIIIIKKYNPYIMDQSGLTF